MAGAAAGVARGGYVLVDGPGGAGAGPDGAAPDGAGSDGTGGPADSTKIIPIRLYETAFRFFDLGYAAAIGLGMLAFSIVIANLFLRILKAQGLAR